MKTGKSNNYGRIKERRFALSLFAIYCGILLLMSGIHTGLIVLMDDLQWNAFLQSVVPILYWGMAAAGITIYTRKRVKDTYEVPLHRMAEKLPEEIFPYMFRRCIRQISWIIWM